MPTKCPVQAGRNRATRSLTQRVHGWFVFKFGFSFRLGFFLTWLQRIMFVETFVFDPPPGVALSLGLTPGTSSDLQHTPNVHDTHGTTKRMRSTHPSPLGMGTLSIMPRYCACGSATISATVKIWEFGMPTDNKQATFGISMLTDIKHDTSLITFEWLQRLPENVRAVLVSRWSEI